MELIVSTRLQPESMAAKIYEGIKWDRRYGNNKQAFVVPQSQFEIDNPELFTHSNVAGKYVLSIQFEDKSVLSLNLYAKNAHDVRALAKEYVRDLMHVGGLERAVWKVENEDTLHFETKNMAKNKFVKAFTKLKAQLDDFFFVDED